MPSLPSYLPIWVPWRSSIISDSRTFPTSFLSFFSFFSFFPLCQDIWVLIPVGSTAPSPALSFYWGLMSAWLDDCPATISSAANELAVRTKHCSSPGTILSSISGVQKNLRIWKRTNVIWVCIFVFEYQDPPIHHTLNVCLIVKLVQMTKG